MKFIQTEFGDWINLSQVTRFYYQYDEIDCITCTMVDGEKVDFSHLPSSIEVCDQKIKLRHDDFKKLVDFYILYYSTKEGFINFEEADNAAFDLLDEYITNNHPQIFYYLEQLRLNNGK